ncbi:alpha/beta fold hydrolase [Phenylobacterium aquaticum]|uniref:alpha/beta fold hydrolase n=1 Tax=Phenylobacterium aquaticum TaxID=1763816 RepID=UPI0026F20EE4|nr:alpha/beta hydrolase [Phenylobacterium aquaticum]
MRKLWSMVLALALLASPALAASPVREAEVWESLPAPAALPAPDLEGRVAHDGARIWFAGYGTGAPVILLHGGTASSDLWGEQVPALVASHHRVLVIDSRGHGRSTRDARPLAYEQMEGDVIAVMDALSLDQAAVVGWSDGGIIGLIMAMKHPDRVSRVFAFGANMDLKAFNISGAFSQILAKVEARLAADYARLSETPKDYDAFSKSVFAMQSSQPNYTPADLAAIHGPRIAIVDGDHEEFISRAHTAYLARTIPGAELVILPGVSHFAPVQDPAGFNAAMLAFLDR